MRVENKLKTFDDDIYDRKVIAENLTKIIEVQEEPMVFHWILNGGQEKLHLLLCGKIY